MKFEGRFRIAAPRDEVFARLNDPQFFVSCLEGVSDLKEIDADHYTATLETRIAYIKFRFDMAVALLERTAPERVVAQLEGTPLGTVGRLTTMAVANLVDAEGGRETDIVYEMEVALTGKLGSLGQPVMKSKAREMEQGFVRKASAAFIDEAPASNAAAPTTKPKPAGTRPVRSRQGVLRLWLARLARTIAARLNPDLPDWQGGQASEAHVDPPADAAGPAVAVGTVNRGGAARTTLDFDLVRPSSVADAIGLLSGDDPTVRPFSGGTALMLMMKSGVFKPTRLVDLSGLESELGGVARTGNGGLKIGGLTRLAELGENADVRAIAPVITHAIPRLSNVRVRNAARVGGCLAHGDPHMDLPPILACLRAEAEIAGPGGTRLLPLEELYVGYYQTLLVQGEIIAHVHIPSQASWQSVYRKMTVRTYDDWPALGVAVSARLEGGTVRDSRVVVSAATEKVTRLADVEALIRGKELSADLCRKAGELAAEAVDTVSDVQGTAAYKKVLIEVELGRALEAFIEEGVVA
ncbi:FAD binding domain-containing protein [Sphingobium sp.]|uniref:FAD binding domain-containing protein n=1 Tax=Sphingobium sp. TaxID=1912891 RepID=UPI0028BEC30A|nr:FAD binding domain-containing protein [Sphingobium sp.]